MLPNIISLKINILTIQLKVEFMIKKTHYPTVSVQCHHEEYLGETLGDRIRTIVETGVPISEVNPLTFDDNIETNDEVDPAANVKTDWFELQEIAALADKADAAAHQRAAAAAAQAENKIENEAAAFESGAE